MIRRTPFATILTLALLLCISFTSVTRGDVNAGSSDRVEDAAAAQVVSEAGVPATEPQTSHARDLVIHAAPREPLNNEQPEENSSESESEEVPAAPSTESSETEEAGAKETSTENSNPDAVVKGESETKQPIDNSKPRSPIVSGEPGVCPRNCSNHGECFLPKGSHKYMCACDRGWEDNDCSIAAQEDSTTLPSFWTILLLIAVVIACERVYYIYKKYCGHSYGRSTDGFSRVETIGDGDQLDHEEFGDERTNDRL